jgi:hypothetical protein
MVPESQSRLQTDDCSSNPKDSNARTRADKRCIPAITPESFRFCFVARLHRVIAFATSSAGLLGSGLAEE